MHVLSFGSQFKLFFNFILDKSSENRLHASKPAEENKLSKRIWMDQYCYSACIFLALYIEISSGWSCRLHSKLF